MELDEQTPTLKVESSSMDRTIQMDKVVCDPLIKYISDF